MRNKSESTALGFFGRKHAWKTACLHASMETWKWASMQYVVCKYIASTSMQVYKYASMQV